MCTVADTNSKLKKEFGKNDLKENYWKNMRKKKAYTLFTESATLHEYSKHEFEILWLCPENCLCICI